MLQVGVGVAGRRENRRTVSAEQRVLDDGLQLGTTSQRHRESAVFPVCPITPECRQGDSTGIGRNLSPRFVRALWQLQGPQKSRDPRCGIEDRIGYF